MTLGGFLAASTSDFVQSIIMTIALITIVGFGVQTAGGFGAVAENARSLPGYLDLFKGYDYVTGGPASYGVLPVASTLAWGLGYFGMPHILLRFMAIEDPQKLSLSRRVATVWVVISMGVAILIGIVGNAMIAGGALGNMPDRLIRGFVPDMIETLFVNFPVFNIADSCLTVGCILVMVSLLCRPQDWQSNNS